MATSLHCLTSLQQKPNKTKEVQRKRHEDFPFPSPKSNKETITNHKKLRERYMIKR